MDSPVVWGIDLGTTTGYAIRRGDDVLAIGARRFSSSDARFAEAYEFFCKTAWKFQPSWVYYEDVRRHPSATQANVYCGMRGVLFAALGAEAQQAAVVPVAVGTLKKFATGNGKAEKAEMVHAAALRWHYDLTHDEADALWVSEFGVQEVGMRRAA